MENLQQQTANQFWETYFPEWVGSSITEREALDIDFWVKLKIALESSDVDIAYAVMLSKLSINVENSEMYIRIVKTAKRVWFKKRNNLQLS
jgi:hypothetical protein